MVKQDIQRKIEQSELKPNQILPSESELCELYQVSRITVRKAVDDLVHEGRLYRMKGKGCFVLDHAVEGLSPIYSFTEAIIHEGKEPSKQLISMVQKKAGGGLGQKMGIFCLHENKEKIFEVYESYVLTDILSYSVEKYNM